MNLRDTIADMSDGVLVVWDTVLRTISQGLPTTRLATPSKQNICASAVSSLARNANLYLKVVMKWHVIVVN
jgi:hypothetical protein